MQLLLTNIPMYKHKHILEQAQRDHPDLRDHKDNQAQSDPVDPKDPSDQQDPLDPKVRNCSAFIKYNDQYRQCILDRISKLSCME